MYLQFTIFYNCHMVYCRTLEERAQRLFGTKGKKSLDPSLFAKNKPGKVGRGKESERQREIASLEAQVYR
jgi:splicing factor 3A subunit 3